MSLPRSLAAALARLPLERLRILEPACGPARYLAHFGPGSVGLDHDPAVVTAFERDGNDREHRILERDLDGPGWEADLAGFEGAWLCDVLMHVRDPSAFLTALQRTLAPGAPVLLVEWCLPGRPLADALARRAPGARDVFETPEHHRTFTRGELEDLVHRTGYRIEGHWLHTFDARSPWLAATLSALTSRFWPVATWHLVVERSHSSEN